MKLSPRLRALYQELKPDLPVADLCCDHGYLGFEAYHSKQFPEIIFVDQVSFAMKLLEKNFQEFVHDEENQTRVQFITADAGKVQSPLTGNIVIAGVGGINMMKILESLHQCGNLQPTRLILSPHKNPELYEKSKLFGLSHSHTSSVMESGYERKIFVFE
jgi:tRNA (adenine22-N1)-methyltransferase